MRSFPFLTGLLVGLLATTSLPARAQAPDTTRIASGAARRGFAFLGQHERSASLEHAAEAARAFAAGVKSDPRDVWSLYGLALTLHRAKKTMTVVRGEGVADGEAAKVAVRMLNRALDVDPDFIEAAELLEHAATRTNDGAARARAFAVLEKHGKLYDAVETSRAGPAGLLHEARHNYEQRDDETATRLYFDGLQTLDPAVVAEYSADAVLIADDQETIALTKGSVDRRAAALTSFWKKRAVRDGVAVPERIGEHYRRLAYARARFRVPGTKHVTRDIVGRQKTGIAAEMDDRGAVYVRYGPPTEPAAWNVERAETGLLTWAYLNPDGRYTVFHFAPSGTGTRATYSLITDLLGAMRAASAEEAAAELGELAKYEPRYAFLAARLRTIRNLDWSAAYSENPRFDRLIRAQSMEDIMRLNQRITLDNYAALSIAYQGDRAHPAFERPLQVFHDFATFRGNACTDLVYSVAAAIPSYRVNVAVADTFTWESQEVDQVVSRELPAGGYLRTTGVFCTKPDYNAFVRLTVSADSMTGVTVGGDITIPDYAPLEGILMSDLLFALQAAGPFTRGRARLAIVPPRQFAQGQPFRVFYELYNLPRGNPYRTEITFENMRSNPFSRLFKGRNRTTVSFEDAAATGDVVQELRTLIPEVEAGEVRVTIKVTDLVSRQSAEKRETIWILAE